MPTVTDFLAMGKELYDNRLLEFVEFGLLPSRQWHAAMNARAIIVHSTRHAAGLKGKEEGKPDLGELEKAATEIEKQGQRYWLSVRDELGKLWRQIDMEVAGRIPLSMQPHLQADGRKPVVRDRETESRDRFIYNECTKGTKLNVIIGEVGKRQNWTPIRSKQGIQAAAKRYATRHSLPPPPRRQQKW
jgi:hypothetical protein